MNSIETWTKLTAWPWVNFFLLTEATRWGRLQHCARRCNKSEMIQLRLLSPLYLNRLLEQTVVNLWLYNVTVAFRTTTQGFSAKFRGTWRNTNIYDSCGMNSFPWSRTLMRSTGREMSVQIIRANDKRKDERPSAVATIQRLRPTIRNCKFCYQTNQ
jgi:hypothetical protein